MKANIILLLGAKSNDKPLHSVPVELAAIKRLFASANHLNPQIEYEPYLTLPMLGDLLCQLTDQVGILHFAGHSNSKEIQTDGESVHTQHIASILKTWDKKPALIFLNGCNSAGQVESFLDAGVTCVIATHQLVDDKQASTFAFEFYANLLSESEKVTADDAFNRAGARVLMGSPLQPRSLDISKLRQDVDKPGSWDWGLFTRNNEWLQNWTLGMVLQTDAMKHLGSSWRKNINTGALYTGGNVTIGDTFKEVASQAVDSTDAGSTWEKNVNEGTVSAGGDVVIGDKN